MTSIYNSTTTTLLVDTTSTRKIVFLPVASTVGAGRLLWIKDISGNAATSSIFISTIGMDRIENRFAPSTLFAIMSTSYGSVMMTTDGILNWYFLQHYYRNAVTAGLPLSALSYLPLSTNSTDIGILPQTVTTNGTVTYSTVGGKQAAYFSNSLSNYLSFTYTNKTTFTLCFWMYPIDGTYYTSLSITTSGYNPALQVDPSSSSVTVYTAMPNQWTNQPTGTTGGPGAWTHFAITINQTTYVEQLYINGSLVDTRTGSGTGISSRNLFIIGKSGDNGRAFYGYIRQFLFFDGVLSGANISSIYNLTA